MSLAVNRSFLRRLRHDRRGNVAMIFALAAIPLVCIIGVAVDLGNAARVRLKLQDATDSAVLAVARDGIMMTDAQLAAHAKTYIDASYNYDQVAYQIDSITFDRNTITAVVDASAQVPTSFMSMFGKTSTKVTAHAVSKGLGFEIAMVLDNSGSMNEWVGLNTKITALKDASDAFLDVMFGATSVSQRFSISVVPFATAVNVGTANKNASWMDTAATPAAKVHNENFVSTNVNRFSLFNGGTNGMKNVSWAGCVISRDGAYAMDDTAPSSGDTLFTPWFAPDEPDVKNATGFYLNNYIDDSGGSCTGADAKNNAADNVRQKRICKYKDATPDTSGGKGPNYNCTSTAITPLTNTRATLNSAISAMAASGNTNILEGLTWGWRTLSPTQPFTQGKSYTSPNNRKVIILMTDGQNYISDGGNTLNKTNYSSFGYATNNRLGTPSSNDPATNTAYLDAKTATACANAKAKGIVIYTIAFDLNVPAAQTLLKNCATKPEYPFFTAPSSSGDLKPVFLAIAQSINRLRLAE